MNHAQANAPALELGRNQASPEFRTLTGVHENFARALGTALSGLLHSEVRAELGEMPLLTALDFQKSIRAPACLVRMQLQPRTERAILHLDCAAAFGLLELLLGGKGGQAKIEERAPTEIEWSLLEEVVRVIARVLGEAWLTFHEVDFKVESLESDPARLPTPEPALPLLRIGITLHMGEQTGAMHIAVPQAFFEMPVAAAVPETASNLPGIEEIERNLELLGEAAVHLEVTLEGPTMAFSDLSALKTGQVVTFDYPLAKQLRAMVNGTVPITGHVVSSGRKRAFQVEQLP